MKNTFLEIENKIAMLKKGVTNALFSIPDVGILLRDTDGTIVDLNCGAEKIFGCSIEEISKENFCISNGIFIEQLDEILSKGKSVHNIEFEAKNKNGEIAYCISSYSPISDDNDIIIGSAVIFRDISETKRAESISVRDAEDISKLKSAFLANISHEIRTPMNGILGFTELALDYGELPEKVRDYLEKIKASSNDLIGVLSSVMDISKIETRKLELEATPFCLHDVFKNCHATCGDKATQKGIMLYFYSEPFVKYKLLGDEEKLTQVLTSLLSNAIKFTNCGIVKMMAVAEQLHNNTLRIHFEVKDSGIGMTTEQVSRVFAPFEQADRSTARRNSGSGLSLSITKNLIELMGGNLKVESILGVGSKFSFDLRFALSEYTSDIEGIERYNITEQRRPIFKGRALVCEDNTINQQVIWEHLTRIGFDVTIASDGKQGIDIAVSQMDKGMPFDIILMDIHMPIMDGLEAAQRLIKIGSRAPIIALTANVLTNDRENYLIHGITDYIGKPFNAQELWSCMMKYITPVDFAPLVTNEHIENTEPQERAYDFGDSTILDKELGLKGAADNKQLYERILSNFYRDNKDLYKEFTWALDSGNMKRAHLLVHSLKGVSALIGATALTNAAHSLEESLSRGRTKIDARELEGFKQLLKKVLLELEPFSIEVQDTIEKNVNPDYNEISCVLDKIEPLVKVGDSKCLDYLDETAHAVLALGKHGKALIKQIEDFDFELAYKTITTIRDYLEV